MRTHINVLGWLQIAIHGIYLVLGIFLFLMLSTAGAVSAAAGGHDGVGLAALLGGFGVFLAGIFLILGLPGAIIGWYIVKGAPWARIAGIVLCILMLINVSSFGLTQIIGIYGLWVLFNPETVAIFEGRYRG